MWSNKLDLGDNIWHGTDRGFLASIWNHGLKPGGMGWTSWKNRDGGSRTNHFTLTRPGSEGDATTYKIREEANCAIQIDPAFIPASNKHAGKEQWKKTAANCLVSYVVVPACAIRKITSADTNIVFYQRPKEWGSYEEGFLNSVVNPDPPSTVLEVQGEVYAGLANLLLVPGQYDRRVGSEGRHDT